MRYIDYYYYLNYLYFSKQKDVTPIFMSSIAVSSVLFPIIYPILLELESILFGELSKTHYFLSLLIVAVVYLRFRKKSQTICNKYKQCKYNKYSTRVYLVAVFILSCIIGVGIIFVLINYVDCNVPKGVLRGLL